MTVRVLQEKEIMRVGGNTIKKINVRIIAATNRDLMEMIKNKEFRADLYYRLKMGCLNIPPLRTRKEDIRELVEYFIACETTRKTLVEEEVMNLLMQGEWHGNIRELKNAISYMVAVGEQDRITKEDIPEYLMKSIKNNEVVKEEHFISQLPCSLREKELEFIMKTILQYNNQGRIVGRDTISLSSKSLGIPMTIYKVRKNLDELERLGFVFKSRGKSGSKLTDKGKKFLKELK